MPERVIKIILPRDQAKDAIAMNKVRNIKIPRVRFNISILLDLN